MKNCLLNKSICVFLSFAMLFSVTGFADSAFASDTLWFSNNKIDYTYGDDDEYYLCTYGSEDVDYWTSSDSSVVKIISQYSDEVYYYITGVGTATITAYGEYGSVESVTVVVNAPQWSLEETSMDDVIIDEYNSYELYVISDEDIDFTAKSSNTKVVQIEDYYDNTIYFYAVGIGRATITVTDAFGTKRTCTVQVKPCYISFGEYSKIVFDNYEDDYEYGDVFLSLETEGDNYIASVKSENTKVVKVHREYDDYYNEYFIDLDPVGAGTTRVIAKDQYGQTAVMTVTVTQKFVDESKYLEELSTGCVFNFTYGERTLRCYCDIAANVYVLINGKKYNASLDEDGDYVVKGLPVLPAGTQIIAVFKKGQAEYRDYTTVQKVHGPDLSAKIKAQTYTGKALKPAVTIKYGKTTLKQGRDYTVKYSNNKKIGKAKATVSFKGNYKGAKAVYFKINPKPTTLTKVTAKWSGFTVKWKKKTKLTSGYQIQYSTSKKFKSNNKKVTVSGAKNTSGTVTGLKSGKKYYVRVRTYKTVGKTKYYSKWSEAKEVTTK